MQDYHSPRVITNDCDSDIRIKRSDNLAKALALIAGGKEKKEKI